MLLNIFDVSAKKMPKDVRRTFVKRIVALAVFEPFPVVFRAWEQIHSI